MLLFCFLMLWYINTAHTKGDEVPDYYWREYTGEIPPDAVEGGIVSNQTTYIGQVLVPKGEGLIPAMIYPSKKEAVSTYKGVFEKDHAKILCSKRKQNLRWINVGRISFLDWFKENGTKFPSEELLIPGGNQDNITVYIGRAKYKTDVIIGKVSNNDTLYKGIHIPTSDGEIHSNDYEVLTSGIPPPDFYWRQYEDVVPPNALEGGKVSDKVTYIGQMYLGKNNTFPVMIYPGHEAEYIYDFKSAFIKVLCSKNQEDFIWVKASSNNFPKTNNLVIGGQKRENILYIGRVAHEKDIIIGRVSPNVSKGDLIIQANSHEEKRSSFYEVLAFKQ